MSVGSAVSIAFADPALRTDRNLVERTAAMVNDVYLVAEAGLWQDGVHRTTPEHLADLIGSSELVLARDGDAVVGCAHVHDVGGGVWSIGMLVVAPERRAEGIGRDLLRFGEQAAREAGAGAAQLELLVPRDWDHPEKVRLAAWYDRVGFPVTRVADLGELYPPLPPLLATPCALEIRQKRLE